MPNNDFLGYQAESFELLAKNKEDFIPHLSSQHISKKNTVEKISPIPLVECKSNSDLFRIIGKLKNHFSNKGIEIYFRGQKKLFHDGDVIPNAFRQIYYSNSSDNEKLSEFRTLNNQLNFIHYLFPDIIKSEKEYVFSNPNQLLNNHAIEPILQHYGIFTRWIDLTDNLPIATWFSLYNFDSKTFDTADNGYILIFGFKGKRKINNGIFEGKSQRIAKLAEAYDPIALRAHKQHAFSLCNKKLLTSNSHKMDFLDMQMNINYNKYILCILKYKKETAIKWIQDQNEDSFLHSTSLFPQPSNDEKSGDLLYQILLKINLTMLKNIPLLGLEREMTPKELSERFGKIEKY